MRQRSERFFGECSGGEIDAEFGISSGRAAPEDEPESSWGAFESKAALHDGFALIEAGFDDFADGCTVHQVFETDARFDHADGGKAGVGGTDRAAADLLGGWRG